MNSYQNEIAPSGHSEFAVQPGNSEHAVEIALEREVLTVICRRSRRRLRDMQASTNASLKLDRARGVLQVKGDLESIDEVRNQLQRLTGPFVGVTAAVWAELMRTRTNLNTSEAAVAQIQQESGCRIHIERSAQQIRLFGPQDSIAIAQQLLEKLDRMCIQESVTMTSPSQVDVEKLQPFAEEFGVTLQVDEMVVTVLGINTAVAEASKALRNSSQRGGEVAVGHPSEICRSALMKAMASLKVDGSSKSSSSTCSTVDTLPQCTENGSSGSEHILQGVVTSKIPPKTPPPTNEDSSQRAPRSSNTGAQHTPHGGCPTCGCTAKFCVNCGEPAQKMQLNGVGCPTCGATKFCVYCGHPTESYKKHVPTVPAATSRPDNLGAPGNMFKPDVVRNYANQVPMMPMQQMQPMQFVHPGGYNLASQPSMPEGMVMMCMNAGALNSGMLAASNGMHPSQYAMLPNLGPPIN